MLLAHVADLHLGKIFHERDLLPDQAFMLDRLLELLALRRPAALLVAGDVYDRSIPSPEAIGLFDSFLSRAIEADPGLVIVVIPGNHDSAARLSFGAGLFERAGVHLRTRAEDCGRPVLVERGGERLAVWPLPFLSPGAFASPAPEAAAGAPAKAEAGVAVAAGAGGPDKDVAEMRSAEGGGADQLELWRSESAGPSGASGASGAPAVPDLPDDLPEGDTPGPELGRRLPGLRSQAELFAEALARIEGGLLPDSANVLLAHCFAAGGLESESERVFAGTAERIDPGLFERFDYAALGHLHRHQPAGPRGRYPGSPLAYSFGEAGRRAEAAAGRGAGKAGEAGAERGFLFVDVHPGGFEAELAPFEPLHAVRRIEGLFSVLSTPGAFAEYRGDYVEARLTDPLPVINPVDPLRSNFPYLLSVRQAAFEILASPGSAGGLLAGGRAGELAESRVDVAEDFRAFHREMKGAEPDEEAARVFAALLEEARRETP